MRIRQLWLTDFRNYRQAELRPDADGLTVVVGANGQGKTNLLEAVAYLATLESFRGAPTEAMVRAGEEAAVVRAEGERGGLTVLLETEIRVTGRNRALVNRQPLRRARDLLGALRVTVFSPEDLALVQGPPAGRRSLLDGALASLHLRYDALRGDVERVLRQRAALLRQAGGRLSSEVTSTLDVWDAKLAELGTALADARAALVGDLEPAVAKAYEAVAGEPAAVSLSYRRSWAGPLAEALSAARPDDLRRAATTVGPHRDELEITLADMPARTHASQGEQRSLALALRLAVHALVTERIGEPPVLLLDDVFSELDPRRSEALVGTLPTGQSLLTTATGAPAGTNPALVLHVEGGRILS
ncbi:MAG TPA: DNA replication/repair protein RecF [Acidimicrobiales bacterium]|nr:DNA replication/repair protein RecF [Acidimicrobiales bacterium]